MHWRTYERWREKHEADVAKSWSGFWGSRFARRPGAPLSTDRCPAEGLPGGSFLRKRRDGSRQLVIGPKNCGPDLTRVERYY
jgi:hypothetical protein